MSFKTTEVNAAYDVLVDRRKKSRKLLVFLARAVTREYERQNTELCGTCRSYRKDEIGSFCTITDRLTPEGVTSHAVSPDGYCWLWVKR